MAKLYGRVVSQAEITDGQRAQMFALFARYYEQVGYGRFCADLDRKDAVILLFDRAGAIQGFSTMQHLEITVNGKVHRGLFSGDTVVAEAYWGQRVLGRLFLRHLLALKLEHPLRPLWWMLISKGYKTYLLMANNFGEHYPRYEARTPQGRQAILDAFSTALFPDAYDRDTGLIAFDESLGQLRRGVAPITAEMLESPRIRFFQDRNPSWAAGTELACLARMTWHMPLLYAAKALWKQSARVGHRLAALPSSARE